MKNQACAQVLSHEKSLMKVVLGCRALCGQTEDSHQAWCAAVETKSYNLDF
jgi:hypothetical protein